MSLETQPRGSFETHPGQVLLRHVLEGAGYADDPSVDIFGMANRADPDLSSLRGNEWQGQVEAGTERHRFVECLLDARASFGRVEAEGANDIGLITGFDIVNAKHFLRPAGQHR